MTGGSKGPVPKPWISRRHTIIDRAVAWFTKMIFRPFCHESLDSFLVSKCKWFVKGAMS